MRAGWPSVWVLPDSPPTLFNLLSQGLFSTGTTRYHTTRDHKSGLSTKATQSGGCLPDTALRGQAVDRRSILCRYQREIKTWLDRRLLDWKTSRRRGILLQWKRISMCFWAQDLQFEKRWRARLAAPRSRTIARNDSRNCPKASFLLHRIYTAWITHALRSLHNYYVFLLIYVPFCLKSVGS